MTTVTLSWIIESNDQYRADAGLEIELPLPLPPFVGLEIELASPKAWGGDPVWLDVTSVCWDAINQKLRCTVKDHMDSTFGAVNDVRKIIEDLAELGWTIAHRSKRLTADARPAAAPTA